MLEIRSIKVHYHRPPNPPRWEVKFRLPPDRYDRTAYPYAIDEAHAYALMVRQYNMQFGRSDDQKT